MLERYYPELAQGEFESTPAMTAGAAEFREKTLDPEVVAPTHCTGWRATHALATAFGDRFIPGSVGTVYLLEGEGVS